MGREGGLNEGSALGWQHNSYPCIRDWPPKRLIGRSMSLCSWSRLALLPVFQKEQVGPLHFINCTAEQQIRTIVCPKHTLARGQERGGSDELISVRFLSRTNQTLDSIRLMFVSTNHDALEAGPVGAYLTNTN